MNLETLWEAAKYVEFKDIQQNKVLEENKHAREEYSTVIKQESYHPPQPPVAPAATTVVNSTTAIGTTAFTNNSNNSIHNNGNSLHNNNNNNNEKSRQGQHRGDDHHTYSSRHQDEVPFDIFKRRPGAGTREVHNKLEKNRRAHLKECFELLKKQLPATQEEKKASNLNILHSALRFIQSLRRKEREYEHEMERLAREKISLQQRFAGLKKELATQWDHIDFNTLIPDMLIIDNVHTATATTHSSNASGDHEEVMVTSDNEEVLQNRSLVYSSSSSLSSVSPLLPPPPVTTSDEPHRSVTSASPKHLPPSREDVPKLISYSKSVVGRDRESPTVHTTHTNKPAHHLPLPVSTSILSTGPGLATFVSQPIQLVAPTGIRMLSSDQPLALSLTHPSNVAPASGVTLVSSSSFHKGGPGDASGGGGGGGSGADTALSLIPANGLRGKTHPIGLAIPNGVLAGKNGTIYKQHVQPGGDGASMISSHLGPTGITHVVAPLTGPHGTIVTPVPVTVVSQGSQVAHILTASPQIGGKVVTPLSLKPVSSVPIVNQYLVKQGTAMVVVSQPSSVPPNSSV